ncbi:MAG: TIGR04211 family SH3 domain-containing protein [Desulfobacteraceae bacterium]|nr:TIGR04211 family SH3 domain-containing protein [Desulfobacteraceae bacterium]
MKRWLAAILVGIWFAAPAGAEMMYVTEIVKITVRTGKGTDHKIIELLPTGEQVNVVEKGPEWSRVQLSGGRQGWVLTRLLTQEPPSRIELEKLRKEHRELLEKTKKPLEEINRLESENAMLQKAMDDLRNAYEQLQASNESLEQHTAEASALKDRYQQASAELDEARSRADALSERLSGIQRDKVIRWFLAGAGVLVLGILIGVFARPRRRRSFLE